MITEFSPLVGNSKQVYLNTPGSKTKEGIKLIFECPFAINAFKLHSHLR